MTRIPLIYLYVYQFLKKMMNGNNIVAYKDLRAMLGYNLKLPQMARPFVLEELEKFKLIKKTSNQSIQVLINKEAEQRLDQLEKIYF